MTLTSQNIDRHQKKQKKTTTRCTKHRQAPKKTKKIQQLLRSGPIVPGNFSFVIFFGAFAGLVHLVVCFFLGACAGLVHLLVCLFFLMPVQVLVILDCVCLDLGHILNLCFKEANIPLSLNSYATTQVA